MKITSVPKITLMLILWCFRIEPVAGSHFHTQEGLSGKEVGVSYKERLGHGIYAVSIRGSKSCKVHLGRLVNSLSTEFGGSGGGHDKACGAVIPTEKMKKFLKEFNAKLG